MTRKHEMLHGPVLVGTNLVPGSGGVLREGARLAHDLSTPLIVCHVMAERLRIGTLFPERRGLDPASVDAMTAAHAAVAQEVASILGDQSRLTEVVVDSGRPHRGVLAQASRTGAGVIVIGPGEVAAQIARHAPVPVLVARPSPNGCVVSATDFSVPSLQTLQVAAAEARRRRAALHLIYILDLGFHPPGSGSAAQPSLDGLAGVALDGADEQQAAAEERLTHLLGDFAGEAQIAVVSGHAERAIVAYAERVGAGLIVVGRHGGSGFAQLTLGGTTAGVIESAPCSVLVSRISAPASLAVATDTGQRIDPVATF